MLDTLALCPALVYTGNHLLKIQALWWCAKLWLLNEAAAEYSWPATVSMQCFQVAIMDKSLIKWDGPHNDLQYPIKVWEHIDLVCKYSEKSREYCIVHPRCECWKWIKYLLSGVEYWNVLWSSSFKIKLWASLQEYVLKLGHLDKLLSHICPLKSKVYLFTLTFYTEGWGGEGESYTSLSLQAIVITREKGLSCKRWDNQL